MTTNTNRIKFFLGMLLACGVAANAHSQRCFETTKDGWQSVEICPEQEKYEPSESVLAGATPFGTVPDWQNTVRRQVGGLQFADVNGDGWVDLVAGCFNSNSFPPYDDWRTFIHINKGGQLEDPPSWFSTDQVHTGDLHIADFNLDSHPDILAVNGGTAYSKSVIYFGSPTGPNPTPGWQAAEPMTTWAVSAAVFDFDHDGDIDIVTSNQTAIQGDTSRPLFLFRNDAGSVLSAPVWQSTDWFLSNGIDVGDFDNDGWEDIAVAKWVAFESGIYRNLNGPDAGDHFTGLPVWSTGGTGAERGAGAYDINQDGWNDVAFGGSSSSSPGKLWHNEGETQPWTFTNVWTSTTFQSLQELRWHDVDGDGDKDLVEIHFGNGQCHIYVNENGTLPPAPSWTYDAPNVGNTLALGDINGDGCDDLAIGYSGEPSIRVFYANCVVKCPGDTNSSGGVDVNDLLNVINGWGSPGMSDVNGDGTTNVDDLLMVINNWGGCP